MVPPVRIIGLVGCQSRDTTLQGCLSRADKYSSPILGRILNSLTAPSSQPIARISGDEGQVFMHQMAPPKDDVVDTIFPDSRFHSKIWPDRPAVKSLRPEAAARSLPCEVLLLSIVFAVDFSWTHSTT